MADSIVHKSIDTEAAPLIPKPTVRYTVSDETQREIRRKFDLRVLPIICTLYLLSYVGRGNIGNAKIAGADRDLGLFSHEWTWVLNSFYISYIFFERTVVLWKMLPARIYISWVCLCWGVAAMCSGAVRNMAQLIVCRCFLGIFEAAFGAGAPYFLSLFYDRRELGVRVSLLLGMSPLANCLASSLAYGITYLTGSMERWRLLFLIEGIPTVIFAPVVYLFLADSPGSAPFLTEIEQTDAVERFQTKDRTAKNKLSWGQVGRALVDWHNWLHTVIHFSCNYSFAGLSNFLPTIVKGLGKSSLDAQRLTAPCYFTAFLLCLATAYASDKYGKRGYTIAIFACIGTVGYLILALVQDPGRAALRYLGAWLAVCGIFPALCVNITWLLNNNGGDSKRGAGLAFLGIFGQCSSFLSSAVFPNGDGPFFTKGCAIGCGLSASIVFASLGIHFGLSRENQRRDELHGPVDPDEQLDVSELGDAHPKFRYLT